MDAQKMEPQSPGEAAPSNTSPSREGGQRRFVVLSWFFFVMGFLALFIAAISSLDSDKFFSKATGGVGLGFVVLGLAGLILTEKLKEDARKAKITRILDSSEGDYFERLVKINVENLSAYYVTVKSHANKSFISSLVVGLVGFAFIGYGMYQSMKVQNALPVATLSGVSGVATEFISAVFFYLYNKTVRQMKEYHDSLLAVQNILLSFKLVGEMDAPEKAGMMGVMINYLVGQRGGTSAVLAPSSAAAIPAVILPAEQPNGTSKQITV